ncbi:hypothetical protein BDW71DRAFT_167319 [Aspergillus fruticulosus]
MAPESANDLHQERIEEARAFLTESQAGGDENSPLANFELQEIVNSIALEARYRKSSLWLDLVRGDRNRHRSFHLRHTRCPVALGAFARWNGIRIVSYCLDPVRRGIGITSVAN